MSLIFGGHEEMKMTETIRLMPLRVLGVRGFNIKIRQAMQEQIKARYSLW